MFQALSPVPYRPRFVANRGGISARPNGTFSFADFVLLGDVACGDVSSWLDDDIFGFSASAGQTITFDVDAVDIGSPLEPQLRLYDSSFTEIASDEPSCAGVRRFWREVRDQFETHEFVEQYDDVDGSYFGIGVIVVPQSNEIMY